jgi:multicomponent Na+:H+ antiporter subunit F
MEHVYLWLALFLLFNLVGGLVRIHLGPSRADRMLAAQLFGTTGVAILLILAEGTNTPLLRDTALVFALLASVNTVVFVGSAAGRAGKNG